MADKEFTKGAKRVLDEENQYVAGFMSLAILDQDGYARKTKGSQTEAPFHLRIDGDNYILESVFRTDPVFHQCIPSETEQVLYLMGKWWMGEKHSATSEIAQLVLKECPAIHKQLDGDKKDFTVECMIPFLPEADKKENLVTATFTTKEQRFVTKVTKCSIVIPKAKWDAWRLFRLKLWRVSKAFGGNDEEDKDKDKKEDGEEDGEKKKKDGE
mmetsp:Transcript_41151/g.94658  ORF Transcript_41151/g.94658 Transcript_41151/m.94658 type:complete len:213 (-) Transcript_41151:85-723(-)